MASPKLRFKEFSGDWNEQTLGKTFSIFNGFAFSSEDAVEFSNCRWVKIADVGINEMTPGNTSYLPDDYRERFAKFILQKGDYVVALTRPTLSGKLKIAQIDDDYNDSLLNQRVGKIVSENNLEFIYNLLQKDALIAKIENRISGSDPPNLSPAEINSIHTFVPSIAEQQKIASFLSAVDEKIQQFTRQRELLEQYKKGVMQQLFSGKLRFKDGNGKAYPKWGEKKLIEIADSKIKWSFTGGPFGSNLKAEDYTENGVRILQLQNIGDGVFYDDYKIYTSEEKANSLISCIIYPGEILISKMGDPVARACKVPYDEKRYLMASDGIRFVPDSSRFDKDFIFHSINHPTFRNKAISVSTGSTRKRIGLTELKEITFSIPVLEEQQKIASFLSAIDLKIESVSIQMEQIQNFKKGLLQQMFV